MPQDMRGENVCLRTGNAEVSRIVRLPGAARTRLPEWEVLISKAPRVNELRDTLKRMTDKEAKQV
ncbi:MAG: hypothetical protein JWO95_618 [Verrucomicrobiales bacterium]|nr:hypothetical protein [Verrucomicrobiales bacterium]